MPVHSIFEVLLSGLFPLVSTFKGLDIHFKTRNLNYKPLYNTAACIFSAALSMYINSEDPCVLHSVNPLLVFTVSLVSILAYLGFFTKYKAIVYKGTAKLPWQIVVGLIIYILLFLSFTGGFGLLNNTSNYFYFKIQIQDADLKLISNATVKIWDETDAPPLFDKTTNQNGEVCLCVHKESSLEKFDLDIDHSELDRWTVSVSNLNHFKDHPKIVNGIIRMNRTIDYTIDDLTSSTSADTSKDPPYVIEPKGDTLDFSAQFVWSPDVYISQLPCIIRIELYDSSGIFLGNWREEGFDDCELITIRKKIIVDRQFKVKITVEKPSGYVQDDPPSWYNSKHVEHKLINRPLLAKVREKKKKMRANMEQGDAAFNKGDYKVSLEKVTTVLGETLWSTKKQHARALIVKAESELQLGMYSNANETFKQVDSLGYYSSETQKLNALRNLAITQFELENFSQMTKTFERAFEEIDFDKVSKRAEQTYWMDRMNLYSKAAGISYGYNGYTTRSQFAEIVESNNYPVNENSWEQFVSQISKSSFAPSSQVCSIILNSEQVYKQHSCISQSQGWPE